MARYRVGLETRERILSATRRLLGEVGFEGVTLKAITDQAAVGAGSFYNLFGSKEEVVFEVIHEALDAVDPDPGGAGIDHLPDLVEAFVQFVTESTPIARIYLQLAVGRGLTDPRVGRRVLRSHRLRVQRFGDALRREQPGISQDEAEARAELLLAGLTGLALTALVDPDFDMHAHALRLLPDTIAGPHDATPRGAPATGAR